MTTFIVPNNKYPTIQSAINAANSGDEIRILPGRYNEYLSIFAKNSLTVCCSNYNGRYIVTDQVVLENCGNEGIGLNIDADNIKIYGLRIAKYDIGINIIGNNNVIDNVNSNFNNIGYSIEGNHNVVQYSSAEYCKLSGLHLQGKYNHIVRNRFNNSLRGIHSFGSVFMGNIFYKNLVFKNSQYNIKVSAAHADKNVYRENTISDSAYGLLNDTGRAAVISNLIFNNSNLGISYQDDKGIILNNTLSNNNIGIYLDTNKSVISGNILEQGSSIGLQVTGNNNYIIQNLIQFYNSTGLIINGSKNILSNNCVKNNCINHNIMGKFNYTTYRYKAPKVIKYTNFTDYSKMLDIFK